MNIEEKYELLIGFCGERNKLLYNMEEVADFICQYGIKDDVIINTESGERFLDTFGIYINKISDMEYREELLKVLVPKQLLVESGQYDSNSFLNKFSPEIRERVEKETEEYLNSETYIDDMGNAIGTYHAYGLDIPTDEELKEELIYSFKQLSIKGIECEMNGHQLVESNLDPENGTSYLECTHCGYGETIRFL